MKVPYVLCSSQFPLLQWSSSLESLLDTRLTDRFATTSPSSKTPITTMYSAPAIHQAVHRRNFPEVQRLVESDDRDVQLQRRTGISSLAVLNEYWREETPLHIACKHGYYDIASYLIASGSDVDGRTGTSPLHLAAEQGYLEVVNLLLQCGADINKRAINGATPLWKAANMGHTAVVRRLAEVGTNVDYTARSEERRLTPLQTASNEGHLGCVEMLISADCDLDAKDSFGRTALHYACDMGYGDIVRCLLTVGADANVRDQQGFYALHAATSMRNMSCIRALAEHGQNLTVGAETYTGTALHLAVSLQLSESIQALIDVGIDMDSLDSSKYTALYLASHTAIMDLSTWYDVMVRLIQAGSDVNYSLPITNSLLEANIVKRQWPLVVLLLDCDCKLRPSIVSRYLDKCPPDIRDFMEERLQNAMSLRLLCRVALREYIRCEKLWPLAFTVDQLPLPGSIKNFLRLEDLIVEF